MLEAYITLVASTFLLLGSPGPAPLALAATGATFGIRQGTGFLVGILVGLLAAIIAVTMGMATLFSVYPEARLAGQVVGALYILYIAYKVASAPLATDNQGATPPGFVDGFILNLVNPKVYAVFLAIYGQFLLPYDDIYWAHVLTATTCFLVAVVVDCAWLALGGGLKSLFSHPVYARVVRAILALTMIVAVLVSFKL